MVSNIVCLNRSLKCFEITKSLYRLQHPNRKLKLGVEKDITKDVREHFKDIVPMDNLNLTAPDLSAIEGPRIVVSDSHMCDDSRANDFDGPGKKEKYLRLIDNAKRWGATWIDIGDRFELWQAKLGDIIKNNEDVLMALSGLPRVIYVLGNHDRSLSPMLLNKRLGNTSFVEYLYEPDGHSFFTHGNIEWENSHATNLGYFIAWIAGQGERLINSRFDEVAEGWWERITPTSRLYKENEPYFTGWVSILKARIEEQGYRSDKPFKLFFGHTHEASAPLSSNRGKVLQEKLGPNNEYWNSGCWVGQHTDYIFIDEKGKVSLKQAQ